MLKYLLYESYLKTNLQEAINITSYEEKEILYTKNMHIVELIFTIVTTKLKALVILRNNFD
jgi:hypothetical protein